MTINERDTAILSAVDAGETYKAIAARFGVTKSAVGCVVYRRRPSGRAEQALPWRFV